MKLLFEHVRPTLSHITKRFGFAECAECIPDWRKDIVVVPGCLNRIFGYVSEFLVTARRKQRAAQNIMTATVRFAPDRILRDADRFVVVSRCVQDPRPRNF